MIRRTLLLIMLLGCSTAPTPISFCERTDLSEVAANYSVTYIKKPDPQFDASYWNLCGPPWTRGWAFFTYSPSSFDAALPPTELDLNQPKR